MPFEEKNKRMNMPSKKIIFRKVLVKIQLTVSHTQFINSVTTQQLTPISTSYIVEHTSLRYSCFSWITACSIYEYLFGEQVFCGCYVLERPFVHLWNMAKWKRGMIALWLNVLYSILSVRFLKKCLSLHYLLKNEILSRNVHQSRNEKYSFMRQKSKLQMC